MKTNYGKYLVEGGMKVDDINNALDIEMVSEDYDSIGGLMIEKLERLPEDQESIQLENGIALQACGIQDNRILKVLITLPSADETEEEEAQAES